jgi:SAM-dependent methyltransferase
LGTTLSSIGERHHIDWLTYNPIQMHSYHLLARSAAPPAIGAIRELFPQAATYVDVGAGSGAFAAEALPHVSRVVACEHSRVGRAYARWQGVESVPFDLTQAEPSPLSDTFDLAYCFEVAEHLPPHHGDRLVPFLCDRAPLVVFSAAQPGQGGLGHINEQPASYWIRRFERQGHRHERDLSDRLRQALEAHRATEVWLLTNTMIFSSRGSRTRATVGT